MADKLRVGPTILYRESVRRSDNYFDPRIRKYSVLILVLSAVIVLSVRPASYTHRNRWGRIISKDMRPTGRILESASSILNVDLVKNNVFCRRDVSALRNFHNQDSHFTEAVAILDWVRNSIRTRVFSRCAFRTITFYR